MSVTLTGQQPESAPGRRAPGRIYNSVRTAYVTLQDVTTRAWCVLRLIWGLLNSKHTQSEECDSVQ